MGTCVATVDAHNKKCGETTPIGYKYCEQHQDRPKAVQERTTKAVNAIVEAPELERQIRYEVNNASASDLTSTSLLGHVTSMVKRVVEFEEIAYRKLDSLQGEWRFRAKDGSEQTRTEVMVYERALDRSARVLGNVTKLGIDAQLANATEHQKEIIKAVLMKTLMKMELSADQIKVARETMAAEFSKLSAESD